jgi:hypothetical protein
MSAYPSGYIEQLARPLRARRVSQEVRARAHRGPLGEQRGADALKPDHDVGTLGSGAGTGAQSKHR